MTKPKETKGITVEHEFPYPGFELDSGVRFVSGLSSRGTSLEELWDNSTISGENMHGNEVMTGWTCGDITDEAFAEFCETLFTEELRRAGLL